MPGATFPEVNGTTIDAVRFNANLNDVAAGITAALAKNGENAATANLPMGGFKHTGAVLATASGEYLLYGQASGALALGSASLPSHTFTGDLNTGMYSAGADTLNFATGGTLAMTISSAQAVTLAAGLTITGALAGVTNLTTTGNTILGNAQGDTLNVANGAIAVGANGNVTIAAPASGTTFAAAGSAGRLSALLGMVNIGDTITFTTGANIYTTSTDTMNVGTAGAATFDLWTNSARRITINSTGNVTVNAPSSGVGLTVAGGGMAVTGTSALAAVTGTTGGFSAGLSCTTLAMNGALSGATTGSFSGAVGTGNLTVTGSTSGTVTVNATGQLYGSALHNNAGAVTGTTNQYVASGTYTPTSSTNSNQTAVSFGAAQWIRVGNVVTVSGDGSSSVTTANIQTLLSISLPIASNIGSTGQAAGVACLVKGAASGNAVGKITGDSAGDFAIVEWWPSATGAQTWSFHFTYVVL